MIADLYPLDWIDEYALRIREFVYVREKDNLLIKVPNEAFKMNDSGITILKRLFSGETVDEVWDSFGKTEEVRKDIYDFFVGLKQMLQGCVNENCLPESVDKVQFDLGFCTLPVLSEVALTYRCNLACRFCYAGCSCTAKTESEPEMNTEQVQRILDTIKNKAEVPSVSFTGGEPTLRQDLPALIRYASGQTGLRVNLITNGTQITPEYAQQLKDAGLSSAQVSLEGVGADIHDVLTQRPGSFKKTVNAVRFFQEAGIIVHTNTTLNSINMDSAERIPAFVSDLGLERFSMNLIIPAGSGKEKSSDGIHVLYSQLPDLLLNIQNESRKEGVEFMWYSPVPACIFNTVSNSMGNKGCAACDGLLSVSPKGEVYPCSSWPEPVGNLLHEDFDSVWNSAQAKWAREKQYAPELCRGCEDFALCQNACPLYWRYHGFDELKEYGEKYVSAT